MKTISKSPSKYTLLTLFLAMNTYCACAEPVQVNITGNVVASPCTLDTANSDVAVNLGDIQATDLAATGATSTPVAFKLKLNACPAATSTAILTFGGTEDASAAGRYNNTGTASNVAIEVLQGSALQGPGTNMNLPVQADRTVTFNLQSRVYAKAQATPGSIISTMQATFTYQ